MTSAFISDGYTETTTIPAMEGISPPVQFTFRPMTASEVGDHIESIEKKGEKDARTDIANRVAGKITDWDIMDGEKKVPITAENLLRLKGPVFARICAVVRCDRKDTDAKN